MLSNEDVKTFRGEKEGQYTIYKYTIPQNNL